MIVQMNIVKKKNIPNFILKAVFILALIFIAERATGLLLKHFFFSQKEGEQSHFTHVIDSTKADILILGSSRACHGYIPRIFENRLHYTCYNAGREGNFVLYNYALFKSITKHYKSKMILFDIRPYDLEYMPYEYDRLSILLPYYDNHPEIRDVLDMRGPFENLKHLSSIYPYNSLVLQIIRGNVRTGSKSEDGNEGYVPLHKTMEPQKLKSWTLTDCNIDPNKIEALEDMISVCKKENIELIFVYSPMWVKLENSRCNELIPQLCAEKGVKYIDISNDTTFMNHPQYFEDITHINDEGARIFTNMLIDRLSNISQLN